MKKELISLNFLELNPKKFETIFYCQKLELIEEEKKSSFYIRNLKPFDEAEKFEKFAIAKKCLQRGMSIEEIVDLTGLNKQEIEKLK